MGAAPKRTGVRGGFTLVEMLVSVALVLLIMSLFAQAFGIAASSIKRQRGLAENDQRARSLVTILLGDLQKRTYRQRSDAITQPVDLPVDVDETNITNARDAFTVNMKRLEDRANRLSLGLVPLHPDYWIGGGPTDPALAGLTPSHAGSPPSPGAAVRNVDSERERGYFHVSEGIPGDDSDDVLKFTINMANTDLGNLNTSRLTGRAVMLPMSPPDIGTWNNQSDTNPYNDVETNLNQPIWDDGIGWVENPLTGVRRSYRPDEPGTTASRVAEVCLFIRGGNLYRRVNLIREPLEHLDGADEGLGQPRDGAADYFGPGVNYPPDSFWNDFDHAATRFDAAGPGQLHFADVASLDNTIGGTTTSGGTGSLQPPHRYWSLGDPRNRFGHDNAVLPRPGGELLGRPKEYLDPSDILSFIGAWTHEETSHRAFGYPGLPGHSGGLVSPMRWGTTVAPNTFDDGPRQGEDLLLANCHAFDVKVWDDVLGQFVDLGHATTDAGGALIGDMNLRALVDTGFPMALDPGNDNLTGRYQAARHGMGRYGGRAAADNRVFDTWHPAFNFTNDVREDSPGGTVINRPDNDPPPYRPLWTDRDNHTALFADGGSDIGFGDPVPRFWLPGVDYDIGDRVFPWPNFPDGTADPTSASPPHMSFFYVCVERHDGTGDGNFTSGPQQPNWPEAPGARIEDTGTDRIVWKAIPNTIGLKAIQISMRFFDPTSGQMRQLTITHSFVEL